MPNSQGAGYVVTLTFLSSGAKIWGDYTTAHVGKQAAFVIDGRVIWAPTIKEATVGGETRIEGGAGGFSRTEAEELAARLKGQ
jgi:preprotein translocase subunit SecD